MAGESQQTPSSEPDPSVLTTQQLDRGLDSARDYVDGQIAIVEQRLSAMDTATRLLNETVNRVPTDVEVAVGNLKELHDEKFSSVQVQFNERDIRQERESRDNKVAVDAAFAAQKEAAAEAAKASEKSIDKSEKATGDKQEKLADLFESRTQALDRQITDLKDSSSAAVAALDRRITAIEEGRKGGNEARNGLYGAAGFVLCLLLIGGFVAAAWPR